MAGAACCWLLSSKSSRPFYVSTADARQNRWGDPPIVVEARLSPLAVVAVALAVVCVLVAGLATVAVAAGQAAAWSLSAAFMLLLFVQFPLVHLPVLMAYVLLCTCRPAGPIRGRGLAWAAIGLSYVALIWHLALTASVDPQLRLAALGVLTMGAMHLPLFAAESRFAKYAVATLVIGGTFLSLLLPWLVLTREESRRLRCAYYLRHLGQQLQETAAASGPRDWHSMAPLSPRDEPSTSPLLLRRITESAQPAPDRYKIPADASGAGDKTSAFREFQTTQPLSP